MTSVCGYISTGLCQHHLSFSVVCFRAKCIQSHWKILAKALHVWYLMALQIGNGRPCCLPFGWGSNCSLQESLANAICGRQQPPWLVLMQQQQQQQQQQLWYSSHVNWFPPALCFYYMCPVHDPKVYIKMIKPYHVVVLTRRRSSCTASCCSYGRWSMGMWNTRANCRNSWVVLAFSCCCANSGDGGSGTMWRSVAICRAAINYMMMFAVMLRDVYLTHH
jgi:hypothetical protein